MSTKGIIYCRVSSQDQTKGTSLEGQLKACQEYATERQIEVLGTFIERGESATAANRTELIKALDFCREHKGEVTAFIVWKIDRFARNTIDHFALKAQLAKLNIRIHSVTEPINDDPIGKMTEAMLAGYAQFENDIRKQRCEGGMKRLVAQGIRPWPPPIGYVHSKDRLDKRKTEPDKPDPERFYVLQRGLREYAKGDWSLVVLAKRLTEWGLRTRTGKPIRAQVVDRVLTDKFYAGIVADPWTGEEYQGKHEPMLTLEEWQRIQEVKNHYSKGRAVRRIIMNPDFPLRGFVKCVCGNGMTGGWRKGSHQHYAYYNCRSKSCEYASRGIPKSELEEKFVGELHKVTPRPHVLKVFEKVVVAEWKRQYHSLKQEREGYEVKLKRLNDRKEELKGMWSEGTISKEEFLELKAKLDNEMTGVQISRNESRTDEYDIEAKVAFSVNFISNVADQWQALTDVHQRQRLQWLVFPQGLTYDKLEKKCNTMVPSPIFALTKEFSETKKDGISIPSHLVAGIGEFWHELADSIKRWTEFWKKVAEYKQSLSPAV